MGAWGVKVFENDDAMDWVCDLEGFDNAAPLQAMFKEAAEMDDSEGIESPEACELLAAAEVVAALDGKPAADLPEEVTEWLAKQGNPDVSAMKPLAAEIVKRVRDGSELSELWGETENLADWHKQVDDLLARLTG